MSTLITKDGIILKSITEYFTKHKDYFIKLTDIIEKKSKISISLVEFFVLTDARIRNIMYMKMDGSFFIVYLRYKNFLKGYGKRYTDPFRRKRGREEKDFFITLHGIKIKTRIAQLNFFKWAFENEIITYIENNFERLENEMSNSKNGKLKQDKVQRARQFQIQNVAI
jgi:hypothetical protein